MNKKILFEKSIMRIRNEGVRNYFLSLFNSKSLLIKIILFLLIGFVVLLFSFAIRNYYLTVDTKNTVFNDGVAFSMGSSLNSVTVYIIQSIPTFISFLAVIFTPKIIYYLPFIFVGFGGLSNIIDRSIVDVMNGVSYYNTVVDYLAASSSIFNLPDMFVVGGVIWFGAITLINLLILIFNDKDKKQQIKKY